MARFVAQPLRETRSPRADRARRSAASRPVGGAESLLALQRMVGNRAVSRLVAGTRQLARVGVDEVQAELKSDAGFAKHYPPWLKIKLSLSGLTEAELLGHFTMNRLKQSVEQSAIHHRNVGVAEGDIYEGMNIFEKAFTFPIAETKKIIAGQLGALTRSPTLQKYAPRKLEGLAKIIEEMEVLRPDAFEERYFATASERGLTVTDELATIDFIKGFTGNAKRVCLRFGSGANVRTIHPAVHEVIHALADPFSKNLFGHNLNEGVTEFITRKVLDEVGPTTEQPQGWVKSDAYNAERGMLAAMMDQESLSEDDVLRAYFSYVSFTGDGPREGVGTAIERFRSAQRAPASSAVPQ
jgi:hypothetical protein